MKIKRENFFVIQGFMVEDFALKGNELLVYAMIYGFSQEENQYFTGSLDYLSSWIGGVSKTTVMKALSSLVAKGLLIKKEIKKGSVKNCIYKAVVDKKIKNNSITETDIAIQESGMDDNKNCDGTITETVNNNIEYNIDNNIFNNIDEANASNSEKKLKEDNNFFEEKFLFNKNINSSEHLINFKKNKNNIILTYIKNLNIGEDYKNKLMEFYNYRKKIRKNIKTTRAIDFILKQKFENEEHAILCIDFAMDNEYIGVRSEYIDYKKLQKNRNVEEEPAFIEIKF